MRILSLLLVLLIPTAFGQSVSTRFTLGVVTADCIAVLSQDGGATPTMPPGSGPAVCPGGFSGNGDYEIYLLNDPGMSGQQLTLYGCQANWGPLVQAYPKTNPQTATQTTTLSACGNGYEVYDGSVVYHFVLKYVSCRFGKCPTWVSTGGSGTLTLVTQ